MQAVYWQSHSQSLAKDLQGYYDVVDVRSCPHGLAVASLSTHVFRHLDACRLGCLVRSYLQCQDCALVTIAAHEHESLSVQCSDALQLRL